MTERQRFVKLLRDCGKYGLLDQGMQIHAAIQKMGFDLDLIMNNFLIDMYGKCCRPDIASVVFDKMRERNVVSWTALMGGYLGQGNARASLLLFCKMSSSGVRPNEYTLSSNLKACGILGVPENGMQIHVVCVKTGLEFSTVVGNSVIDMYSRCGRIEEATQMFNLMPVRNLITWNAMITGYTHTGYNGKSLLLFKEMQIHGETPDEFTYSSVLKSCSGLGAINEGAQIHGSLITRGFPIGLHRIMSSVLIDFYVKCRCLHEARKLFDHIEPKNAVFLTAMIIGYAQDGGLQEAMDLFRQFMETGAEVDAFVISSMMSAFADFAHVEQGKQVHSFTVKVPSGLDVSVANSIVDMYVKCGLMEDAEKRFNEIPIKNVVSWTVMITGYGKHGSGKDAIRLFEEMQGENIEPDEVTYLAVLSACSHAGLIEESSKYFSRLCKDHQCEPKVEHYACMVDLLGRAGRLEEAYNLIKTMPLEPSVGIWQTLLSACRLHSNLEIGREVGEVLLKLDYDNPVNHIMMSNLYVEVGEWKEYEKVRKLMKVKGLQKEAGCSWIEIDKEMHYFYGRDERHHLTNRIHNVLKEMERRMKEEIGYAYDVRFALHDVEEESKEESLRFHSEKLAIGLGLVCNGLEKEGIIRVFKNLRVCGDCHEFIKGLSKLLKKVFLVRDATRFHRFEDGVCSCGDYW